jgi:hypothetical protein
MSNPLPTPKGLTPKGLTPKELTPKGLKCYDGPLTGNLKCILISFGLAGSYWFLPSKNKWVLAAILYLTYLAIAWYDEYLCQRVLTPSYLRHFYDFAKPRKSTQSKQYKNLCPNAAKKILVVDIFIAIMLLIILPFYIKWDP